MEEDGRTGESSAIRGEDRAETSINQKSGATSGETSGDTSLTVAVNKPIATRDASLIPLSSASVVGIMELVAGMFDTKRNERFGPPPEPYERALQSEQQALEASKSSPNLGVNQELEREEHRKLEPYQHAVPENSHENP